MKVEPCRYCGAIPVDRAKGLTWTVVHTDKCIFSEIHPIDSNLPMGEMILQTYMLEAWNGYPTIYPPEKEWAGPQKE